MARLLDPDIIDVLPTHDARPELLVDWQPAGDFCTVALIQRDELDAELVESEQEAESLMQRGRAVFYRVPSTLVQRYLAESASAGP